MPERFEVYRYFIVSTAGPAEARWSFAPLKGVGHAGHVEAPEGSRIASFEPPVLDIPGRGEVDLLAVIGVTEGQAEELDVLLRWHPLR